MMAKGTNSSRQTLLREAGDNLAQDQLARGEIDFEDARDDLVRILATLVSDLERFDSMVTHERDIFEERSARPGATEDDRLNRLSTRISLGAAEMISCARHAQEELRRLAEPTSPRVQMPSVRAHESAKDQ